MKHRKIPVSSNSSQQTFTGLQSRSFTAGPPHSASAAEAQPGGRTLHNFSQLRLTSNRLRATISSGRSLPDAVRRKMSRALGHDFSSVRIHEDQGPEALDAIAYTRGQHIHFAPGYFQPQTRAGQELLGHELSHVAQQAANRVQSQSSNGPATGEARLEQEADVAGARAAHSSAAAPRLSQSPLAPATPAHHASQSPAPASSAPIQYMRRGYTTATRYVPSVFSTFRNYSSGSGGGGQDPRKPRELGSSHAQDATMSYQEKLAEALKARQRQIQEREEKLREQRAKYGQPKSMFRYVSPEDPHSFHSPAMKNMGTGGFKHQYEAVQKNASLKNFYQDEHEGGGEYYQGSPYISVAGDFVKPALTTDPWLEKITKEATHLSLIHMPEQTVHAPRSQLSKNETEHLYLGEDMKEHVGQTIKNPMLGGIPRFSTLPPDFIGALMQYHANSGANSPEATVPASDQRRYDSGRETQHRTRIERMRDKLKKKEEEKKK